MASWRLRCRGIPAGRETDSASRQRKATTAATAADRFPRPRSCRGDHASNAAAPPRRVRASSACPGAASPSRRARKCGRAKHPARYAAPWISAALARCLFVKARLARARAKLDLNLVESYAAGVQHDQEVIEHVGGFRRHAAFVLADCGERGLDRLLAEFFRAVRHTAIEQLSRIGHIRAFAGALLNTLFQIVQRERGHVRSLASPRAHRESRLTGYLVAAPFRGSNARHRIGR